MTWLLRRGRVPYVLIMALLTAFLGLRAMSLEIDGGNEAMNARSESLEKVYPAFKRTFGSDEDLLLTVTRDDLLTAEGLQFIDELSSRISRLDDVLRVDSLVTTRQIVSGRDGAEARPLITALEGSEVEAQIRSALDWNPHLTGLLISPDRKTAGLVVQIEPNGSHDPGPLITSLRRIMEEEATPQTSLHLTGLMVQKYDVGQLVQKDERILVPLSVVVLAIVLALFFRRVSGVVLPLLVTGISVVWTMGAYSLAGLLLNPVTSLLPPVVMVLSITTSVHLYHGWLRHEPRDDAIDRLVEIVRKLRIPCFLAALTTALGFASLCVSEIPAVRYFGFFAAFGVSVSFFVAMSLLPVGLSYLPAPAPAERDSTTRHLREPLRWIAETSIGHPGLVLAAAALLSVVAAVGITQITSNTDLVRFFKSDAPLYRDTLFIDRHLSGPNNLELVLSRRDGAPLTTAADVERMARFERVVSRQERVASVFSIVSLLEQLHRAESGTGTLEVPSNDYDLAVYFELLSSSDQQEIIRRLVDSKLTKARIRVNVHAIGSAAAATLIDTIEEQGREIFGPAYTLTLTGSFHQFVEDSNRLVRNQAMTFSLAFILVFLACGWVFRSLQLMAVSLIANLLPVLWTAGAMGFAGIELSTGTVMIASVVIGIAVDDTIHFLNRFVRERGNGTVAAIRSSTMAIGPAMITSSLALALGFWVGCFGSFWPTVYFSLLTGGTMLTALACDLFVLPASLLWLDRRRA